MNFNKGFTLVEMLIALLLSTIILAGIGKIFVGSKMTYSLQQELSRIQENGRFSMNYLAQEIRPVGFQGCPNLSAITPTIIVDDSPPDFNLDSALVGYDYDGSSITGYSLPAGVTSGTSIITIQRGGGCSDYLTTDMVNNTDDLSISNNCGFKADDVLVLSDCKTTDIFLASSGSANGTIKHATGGANTLGNLSKLYSRNAEIFKLSRRDYYIKDSSLFRRDMYYENDELVTDENIITEEIIEGVGGMTITYGVMSSFNKQAYISADDVTDWRNVKSVNIELKLKSVGNSNNARLQNKDFSTTIFLRNRV
ncbi:MAG: PilW family protein [Methylococcales bacterium]|nr:PilW family protein [Methylococcales bacterium]